MEISMEYMLFDIMVLRVDNQRNAKIEVGSDSDEMWTTQCFLSKIIQGSLKGESGHLSQVAWGFSSMHLLSLLIVNDK